MFDQNFSSLEQIKHETTHEERKKGLLQASTIWIEG